MKSAHRRGLWALLEYLQALQTWIVSSRVIISFYEEVFKDTLHHPHLCHPLPLLGEPSKPYLPPAVDQRLKNPAKYEETCLWPGFLLMQLLPLLPLLPFRPIRCYVPIRCLPLPSAAIPSLCSYPWTQVFHRREYYRIRNPLQFFIRALKIFSLMKVNLLSCIPTLFQHFKIVYSLSLSLSLSLSFSLSLSLSLHLSPSLIIIILPARSRFKLVLPGAGNASLGVCMTDWSAWAMGSVRQSGSEETRVNLVPSSECVLKRA